MEEIRCPFCGFVMILEEASSYYADSDWEYICVNIKCKGSEEEE